MKLTRDPRSFPTDTANTLGVTILTLGTERASRTGALEEGARL